MIREVSLKIQNAQSSEQTDLQKELEKKHNQELIDFREDMAKKQGELRKQLLGDSELVKQENDADAKVVEQFQAKKKLEEERRVK